MLGPVEVRSGGRPVAIGRGKQRALLALLLLEAGRVVPAERLIDELWGERPPPTAATALQVYVSKLRKALGGGAIRTSAPGYVLECEPDDLDLRRFERLTADARGADPEHAARLLREALALWRGSPLADVDLPVEAARLEELRLAALERRFEAELTLGHGGDLVAELEALVAEHPLREPFRAQLMVALYQAGRQADALDAYRDARRRLLDELGIEPGEQLKATEQAILRHDPSLMTVSPRTSTATVVFLDLGVRGEVERVAGPALSAATEELGRTAERVERGIADALLAVFRSADDAVAAASAADRRLVEELGGAVAPRAGAATGEVFFEDRVTGAAVVLAARRVRDAKPGEIAVGERTAAAATSHRFRQRGDAYVLIR